MQTTLLQAVNSVLSNVGQAPITSLDTANPIAALSQGVIQEVTQKVQAEGWSWNSEYEYPVKPDNDGYIYIPDNVITFDPNPYETIDPIVRSGRLYDRANHTFEFDKEKTYLFDVVWSLDFEDMPEPAKAYVVSRAANIYAYRAVGATDVAKYSQAEEAMTRAALIDYECQQTDPNIFQAPVGRSRGFSPFQTIYRY